MSKTLGFIVLLVSIIIAAFAITGGEKTPAGITPMERSAAQRLADAAIGANPWWSNAEWRAFVTQLNDHDLVDLALGYGAVLPGYEGITEAGIIRNPGATINLMGGRDVLVYRMQTHAMDSFTGFGERISNSWNGIPQHDVRWHALVQRACYHAGLDGALYDHESSFASEWGLLNNLVGKRWEQLTPEQRRQVISKDATLSGLSAAQQTAIVAGTGAAFIATLATTTALTGFAFYTTMSSVLATIGSVVGGLPFAAYIGASTTVGMLSGPVGWTLVAVGAVVTIGAGIYSFVDKSDPAKLTRIVISTHLMRVRALHRVGRSLPE